MFTQLNTFAKAGIYYLITFGLAVVVAIFGEQLGEISMLITMFTPTVATLLMLLVITRDGYTWEGWKILGLHRLGVRGWPLAILLPLVILGTTYCIIWATGIGRFIAPEFEGTITLGTLVSSFVGLLVGFGLAEEIGWRGYLLPNLLPMGRTRALLLSGLMHGAYHLPLMLLTPYYHGTGNRWIVVALFLLTTTAAGVCYGYLRLTTNSVWPASLAHNTFNSLWTAFSSMTVAVSSPLLLEYLAGESGIITLIGVSLTALWLINRLNRREQPQPVQPVLAPSH
jgi:membrane protease YdiL (CAAX protease family)